MILSYSSLSSFVFVELSDSQGTYARYFVPNALAHSIVLQCYQTSVPCRECNPDTMTTILMWRVQGILATAWRAWTEAPAATTSTGPAVTTCVTATSAFTDVTASYSAVRWSTPATTRDAARKSHRIIIQLRTLIMCTLTFLEGNEVYVSNILFLRCITRTFDLNKVKCKTSLDFTSWEGPTVA